ncbi:hypothetical protein K450DRAFT_196841 [Umbelopsis ramanniana AG]|uniref:Uncharacterized protein n=1 Tax=Umbelopsis ramanniana AG TaxID=1314678 RepID=A0AAD5EFM0_UMBRA|nr:uncharacterized protein K450DRAFT_196841 [Umbelopsis ramanniana AG]KAI8582462.1 hypothetical protein K450DRAFT_196841 [Umbelopsis ramanniana AG]
MSVNEYCYWMELYRNVSVLPNVGSTVGSVSSPSDCGAFWTASVMVYNYTCDASNTCTTYYSSHGQMYPRVAGSEKCDVDVAVGPNLQPLTQYRSSGVHADMTSSQPITAIDYMLYDNLTPEDKLFEYSEWNVTNYKNFSIYGLDMLINAGCPICTKFTPGVYLQMCYYNCTQPPPNTLRDLVTSPTSSCPSLSSNANRKSSASKSVMLYGLVVGLAMILPIIQ